MNIPKSISSKYHKYCIHNFITLEDIAESRLYYHANSNPFDQKLILSTINLYSVNISLSERCNYCNRQSRDLRVVLCQHLIPKSSISGDIIDN